jgi:Ca2+-binding RTX toxin-like protein
MSNVIDNDTTGTYNSDNFDLNDWDITIPVNPSGGVTGLAETVLSLTDYSSPYFYANADGSMTFMSPVVGATTENTYGARSELRELNPNGSIAAWNLAEGGTMSATLAVNSLPILTTGQEGKIMVAQIHGNSGELIRLYDDAGKIYFIGNNPASQYTSGTFQLTDAAGNNPTIALNQQFSYMINAQGSTLTVKVYIGNDVYTSVTAINPDWQSETLYFKAGVYDGDAGTTGTDLKEASGYGQATFYGLDMSHTSGQGLGGLIQNAPVAIADTFTGKENQAITGNVLTNDTGTAGDTLSVTAQTMTTAHGGTVVQNADGTFTYTPATGYTGTDSFNYKLADGTGLTSTGTVALTVSAPLQAPVAQADAFGGQENKPVTGNLMADNGHGAATDPNGLALNVIAATVTTANGGTVVENADGTFTYTPANGYTGTDSFNYTLTDSAGMTVVGTATITVNAPPVAQADIFTGQQNHSVTGNLMADNGNGAATDQNGLALSIVAATITTANGGTVVENANGTFTYTPATGYSGTDSFNYTLEDSAGLTATGTASLTISAATTTTASSGIPEAVLQELNGIAPTITMTSTANGITLNGTQSSLANVIMSSGKNDLLEGHDGNDVLIGGTGGDKLYGYYGNDLIYSGEGNNILNGGPGNDTLISASGSNNLTGGGGNDVIVFSEAKAPNAYDIITDFNTSDNKLDLSALMSANGTARLQAVSGGTGLYVDSNGTGNFTLLAIFEGTSNVTASTSLNSILTSPVHPSYSPPVAQPDIFSGQENGTITGNLMSDNGNGAATDPNGLALSVVAATLTTAHGGTVVEHADGTFTYTSATGYIGADSFNYTLEDSAGLTATGTASITVNAPVPPPAYNIPAAVTAELGGVAPAPTMTSTANNATLDGSHGSTANIILSSGNNDYLEGHDGNDVLIGGGTGGNKLYGYYGNDLLYSGEGNNTLNGGPGNDTLISGSGSNNLTGGGGNDVFVFSEAKAINAHDVITDFTVGSNKLDISALLGQHGEAQLETVSGVTGLYVDATGAGHYSLLVQFEGTSNVTLHTPLTDILTS